MVTFIATLVAINYVIFIPGVLACNYSCLTSVAERTNNLTRQEYVSKICQERSYILEKIDICRQRLATCTVPPFTILGAELDKLKDVVLSHHNVQCTTDSMCSYFCLASVAERTIKLSQQFDSSKICPEKSSLLEEIEICRKIVPPCRAPSHSSLGPSLDMLKEVALSTRNVQCTNGVLVCSHACLTPVHVRTNELTEQDDSSKICTDRRSTLADIDNCKLSVAACTEVTFGLSLLDHLTDVALSSHNITCISGILECSFSCLASVAERTKELTDQRDSKICQEKNYLLAEIDTCKESVAPCTEPAYSTLGPSLDRLKEVVLSTINVRCTSG